MKKVFVGNLASTTSEDVLRELFTRFGSVGDVTIVTDRATGQSRGFAFVEMTNAEDADKAIAGLNGTLLDERALNVNEARPKRDQGSFRDSGFRGRRSGGRW